MYLLLKIISDGPFLNIILYKKHSHFVNPMLLVYCGLVLPIVVKLVGRKFHCIDLGSGLRGGGGGGEGKNGVTIQTVTLSFIITYVM